jgi:transposase InsO family protein
MGQLSPSTTSLPWQVIFMDFIGPFPMSPSKNTYVVTAIDSLTKYAFALAVPAADQVASLKMLRQVLTFGGVPGCVRTDQGSHFTGTVFEDFCRRLGLAHITSAPYHHEAQGQVERLHSTIEDMVATSLGPAQQTNLFDELLDCFLFAYNTTVHPALGDTPFFLLFGRDPVLPSDLLLLSNPAPALDEPLLGYRESALERRAAALGSALDRLDGIRLQMQARYNSTHDPSDFRVGDLVLLLHDSRGPGAKLASPWCGPFRVLEVLGRSRVRLSPVDNPLKKGISHVSRIKHYYTYLHRESA